jgi:para-nitrobenzyl esterase
MGFRSAEGAHVWRGVRFARPPLGELRWRSPQPPEPWSGVFDARFFGPACVQFPGVTSRVPGIEDEREDVNGSEDCLTLNIFAPHFDEGEVPDEGGLLPVMLWIHGGGNSVGSAAPYDGGTLATRHRVLVVTTHYRLGVFGWLSHPSLAGPDGSADDRSGNFGNLDQIRALEWIQANIAAFGGDPERVTIFGESAGGRNVIGLLASPRARGLFHRAVAQSGNTQTVSLAEARNLRDDSAAPGDATSSGELLLALLTRDGRAADRSAAKAVLAGMRPAEVAAYLRAQPDAALLEFFRSDPSSGMYRFPQMLRDGRVLPAEPVIETFARPGGAAAVPAIFGSNRDEDKLFMLGSSDAVGRIAGIPLWLKDRRRYELMAEYRALAWKARAVDEPVAALRSPKGPAVYAYRFDWDEEPSLLWLDFSVLLGAAHALEIPFVFGTLDFFGAGRLVFGGDGHPGAVELAERMASYWAEFAHTGDPGRGRSGELPRWSPWDGSTPDSPRFLVFDSEAGGGLRMSPESVTTETVIARAATDPRFRDLAERCEFLGILAHRGHRYDPARYAAGPCGEIPLPADPRAR